MAINVARFEYAGTVQWGVVKGNHVVPIETKAVTTGEFIQSTTVDQLKEINGDGIPWQAIKLMSPITRNQQFVCQGANYRQHMIESGIDPDTKQFNMIFTKSQSCIVAADSPVIIPKRVRFLDYEVELGLVLRKEIRKHLRLTSYELPQYIAGLVVVNDYSARDVQIPEMQFYKGKSFRTFGPVGPWLCLLEDVDFSYLNDLQLELDVDGDVRQRDNTKNLVFKPAETLSELSGVQDFYPGDLIATGTPAGCALAIPSPGKQKLAALILKLKNGKFFLNRKRSASNI